MAAEEEHPKEEVYFPVIVLTHVIRQLTALPVALSYRLPEVLDALPGTGSPYKLQPRDLFWFNLSNLLKSDAIYLAWHRGRTEAAYSDAIRPPFRGQTGHCSDVNPATVPRGIRPAFRADSGHFSWVGRN